MRTTKPLLPLPLLLLACCDAARPPAPVATPPASAPILLHPDGAARAAAIGSHAAAVDARGVPTLLVAATHNEAFPLATPEGAARHHLARHLGALALPPPVLEEAEVRAVSRNAIGVIARIGQRVDGVEVYRSDLRMLLRPDGALLAMAGRLHAARPPREGARAFRTAPQEALRTALADAFSVEAPPAAAAPGPHEGELALTLAESAEALRLTMPARAKRVWFPDGNRLRPAWHLELYAGRADAAAGEAYRYVIAADDGRVLDRRDLTLRESFDYRVWADEGGDKRPHDDPIADFTPHPTGQPDGREPAFTAPALVRMEGFNVNPMGAADPWLPPAATQTSGNNVDAYVDRNPPDGLTKGDFRATLTGPRAFDRTYDLLAEPLAGNDQAMAGVTQLFYVTNWLHDWFYGSGFTEAAGNAQRDNLGRGGLGADRMLVEAQDDILGGSRNNSNMATPSDGYPPRMQVFVWSGPATYRLTLTPGGDLSAAGAGFGQKSFDVSGDIVVADDGAAPAGDGCEPIKNDVKGRIVLIDRGTCTYKQKAVNAQAAGAAAILFSDTRSAVNPPEIADADPAKKVTLPVLAITLASGDIIRAGLAQRPIAGRLFARVDPDRDGALANTVIAHEWGHYLHHRLADCALQQCGAMSEGWGDFLALHMILREGDRLDGSYAVGIYPTRWEGDSAYFGIRRQPYSTDLTKNGLTLRHIANGQSLPANNARNPHGGGPNCEVHNAGEVWATMLFEAYTALVADGAKRRPAIGFEETRRRMGDYVVTGLQLTPADATFTEGRDAILAAAAARSPEDLAVLAAAFARRGAGTCAVSPPRESKTLIDVVESFDVKPRVDLGEILLDDAVQSCDHDGVLDAGERGRLAITVHNGGTAPLAGTVVRVSSTDARVRFPNGPTANVPEVAPYQSAKVEVEVALDPAYGTKTGGLPLTVRAENAGACESGVARELLFRANFDDLPASATTDDVESERPAWTATGELAAKVWERAPVAALQHAWHGADFGAVSDTALESPALAITSDPFTVKLLHRHAFEAGADAGGAKNFDGGVIELQVDGGEWQDASLFTAIPYGGPIGGDGNPLLNQNAFVGTSAAWPDMEPLELDFGTGFAGHTVKIRFRIGTDQGAGEEGWFIDDIAFTGIEGRPFATLVDDRAACGEPPEMGKGGCSVGGRRNGANGAWGLLVLLLGAIVRKTPSKNARPAKKTSAPANGFTALVESVRAVHEQCAAAVNRTVNTTLTLRNWLIGGYIRTYEQRGADRAQYGSRLLETLSESLQGGLDRCYTGRYLGLCRQLFDIYPMIRKSLISESGTALLPGLSSPDLLPPAPRIRKSAISESGVDARTLVQRLSFTHLVELIAIEDPLKRAFYEVECVRGNWSVRALKRQIATLYFERSGLSADKDKLARRAQAVAEKAEPRLAIRDPYVFEFLGLRAADAAGEATVEDALLDNLRDFLMEMGHGFCLEARQKSIVLGETRGFVDLVFYHRVLKCHVLVELKVDAFSHEHLGQLNTYVTWYRKHMMTEGDNPPVGLLLCTQKDHVLVEYATAHMDNRLFVSRYQLELPRKEALERFLQAKREEIAGGSNDPG